MYISQLEKIQRREFMRRATALGIVGSAGPLALSLAAIGEAAAATAPSDYKALVCIFLYGGNDHDNTFIPLDSTAAATYRAARNLSTDPSDIYIGPDKLLRLVPTNTLDFGRQYAVQPVMGDLANLFNQGKLGVLLNVGTLAKPLTKAQYTAAKAGDLPPKLFSHNDQFNLWQTNMLTGAEGSTSGWGGRMGDIFLRNSSANSNAHFTCINSSSNAVFLAGGTVLPYRVTPSGAIPISSIGNTISVYQRGSAPLDALQKILQPASVSSHWMEAEWSRVIKSSIDNQSIVNSAISGLNPDPFVGKSDSLSAQLKIIAQMIGAAKNGSSMGVSRQVFFA